MDDENKKILKEIVEQAIDRKLDDRDRKSAEKTRLKELANLFPKYRKQHLVKNGNY